jgi:hypothetical protein
MIDIYLYVGEKYTSEQFEKARKYLTKRLFKLQINPHNSDFYILQNTKQEDGTYTNLEIMFDKIQVDFPVTNSEFELMEKIGYKKIFFQETMTKLFEIFNPKDWNISCGDRIEFVAKYKELMFLDFKEK